MVSCHYAGRRCNFTDEFRRFFDPYYFNCFTYMATDSQLQGGVLAEGIENGWSVILLSGSGMLDKNEEIRMLPGLHEWSSPVSASEGVRVVIHPPDTQPYPFTEGFDVPPGFSASFGIRPRINIRIPQPHGNCSGSNPFDSSSSRYRLMACQKMCLQRLVAQRCGCLDVGLPKVENFTHLLPCRDDSHIPDKCMFEAHQECLDTMFDVLKKIQCARETKGSITKNSSAMADCNCFPPCDEVSYDVSYSLSKWPSSGYEGDAAYFDIFHIVNFTSRFLEDGDAQVTQNMTSFSDDNTTDTSDDVSNSSKAHNFTAHSKFELFRSYFSVTDREETMKNFARLNVYIADSNVVKTEESEEYNLTQLVSDIGGQLGLWVGISVITIAEVIQLLVDILRYLLGCTKRKLPKRANALRHNNHEATSFSATNGHVVNNNNVHAQETSRPAKKTQNARRKKSSLSSLTSELSAKSGRKLRKDRNSVYRDVMTFVDETARRTSEVERRSDVTNSSASFTQQPSYKHKDCYNAFPQSSCEYS